MQFSQALRRGRLIRRYKRFFADIELDGGEIVIAHCANPGSMKECAPEGAPVWVSPQSGGKLAYRWELCQTADAMICVNTFLGNRVVEEALALSRIEELRDYPTVRREVKTGAGSRIDFLLSGHGPDCYLEVKTVTMAKGPRVSQFPDAVTTRGRRHLLDLAQLAAAGHRAVLLFMCARDPTDIVTLADHIDPAYGQTLRQVQQEGVEVLAYGARVTETAITLERRLEIDVTLRS